jgi:hypothetical protein
MAFGNYLLCSILGTIWIMSMNIGNLSLLCWNVRGLGNSDKCAVVKETLNDSNVTIFCL